MTSPQKNNPLHGITLKAIVTELEAHYGWEKLGEMIDIRCFNIDPSINSSLKFLRNTPWARTKVEELYLTYQDQRTAMHEASAESSVQMRD